MAFDKELYSEYRKMADSMLRNIPVFYTGTIQEWVLGKLELIKEFNQQDDFEASKAIKDSVLEYINEYLSEEERIPLNAMIKIEST